MCGMRNVSRWLALGLVLILALSLTGGFQGAYAKLVGGVWAKRPLEQAVELKLTADQDGKVEIAIGDNRITFRLLANEELDTGLLRIAGDVIVVRVFAGEELTDECTIPIDELSAEYKQFCYDKAPPVVRLSRSPSPNANGWNRGEVTVTVTATDEEGGSGIAAIYYKIGTRSPVEVGKDRLNLSEGGRVARYSLTIRDEGTHHLGFWAVDQAGNESEHQALTVKIDPTKPSISVSLSPTSVYPGDCIRVTIRASDGLSGIDSVTASDSNLGKISLSRSGSEWRGTIHPRRSGRVTVTAKDKAGNTSSDSASYTVKTRPAFFEVTGLSISPSRPEVGETVTIEARIRNTGGSRDRQKVILYIDGYRVNSKYITLDPGESEWVRFHYAFSTSGTHHVVIKSENDEDEEWIQVIHPPEIKDVRVIGVIPGYHGFPCIEVAIWFYDEAGDVRYVLWRYRGSYDYTRIDVSKQVFWKYGVIVLDDEDSLPCASGREIELVLEDSAGLRSEPRWLDCDLYCH